MRVIATTDFVGSFFPQPTSYGELPGGAALQATVDALRTEAGGGLWIDTGDLTQGSALGALSDGTWPFVALRELSIDAAVVGNHELDWGPEHLHRWRRELPFPLLAANLPLGLPPTFAAGDVGVIGLSLQPLDPDTAGLISSHAAELRRDGARHVVLALHDGIGGGAEEICAAVRGDVDLVLGGHTLKNFAGTLAGIPFLQAWAFGSQVGVADLGDEVELRLADVGPARPWTGAGAAAQAELEREIVGRLEAPLAQADGRTDALACALGDGLLRVDDRLDGAYVAPGDLWNQPARDGIHAFLGAGDVNLAQVLRLAPLTGGRSAWGGQLVAAELRREALPAGGTFVGRPGVVALSPHSAPAGHDWRPIEATWRDALLAAVSG